MPRSHAFVLLSLLTALGALGACASDSTGDEHGLPELAPVEDDLDERPDGSRRTNTDDAGPDAQLDAGPDLDPDPGPFGITSCRPRFEEACKPPVIFLNDDPEGRGKVFTDAVGDVEATMQEIACTACSILYRDPSEIPANKHPSTIRLLLDTHGGVAQAGGDTIQFDLNYIESYRDRAPDEIRREMLGVLQHEAVHLYQNYGNTGTGEGLADLVRARTGHYPASRWRAGEGTWRDPYTASGNFYSWLTGPSVFHTTFHIGHDLDFPYKLNRALAGQSGEAAYEATAALIEQLFGVEVEQLWQEYQRTAF